MAMFDEPYLVTSYSAEAAGVRRRGDAFQQAFKLGVTSVVYREDGKSSSNKVGKQQRRRAIAVNTVQNNGVHLVDLADQSPLAAFTVSPATVFTSQAISISYESAKAPAVPAAAQASTSASVSRPRSRKTFAGLELDGEYQLCCWTEQEAHDGTAVGETQKSSVTVADPVISLSIVDNGILAFSKNGQATAYTFDLAEITTCSLGQYTDRSIAQITPFTEKVLENTAGKARANAAKTYMLPVAIHTAPPTPASSSSPSKSRRRSSTGPSALAAKSDSSITSQMSVHIVRLVINMRGKKLEGSPRCELPGVGVVDIAQIGNERFAAIGTNGELAIYRLNAEGTPAAVTEQTVTFKPNLLFTRARLLPLSTVASPRTPLSSSRSSCIAIAAPRADKQGILDLLIWDYKVGLALDHREISLPCTSSASAKEHLGLAILDNDLIGIAHSPDVEAPAAASEGQNQLAKRSTLHAVTCVVPAFSTLASVIGKQTLTQRYVHTPGSDNPASATGIEEGQDGPFAAVLSRLSLEAATRNVDDAYRAFGEIAKRKGQSRADVRRLLQAVVPEKADLPAAERILKSLLRYKSISDADLETSEGGGLTMRLVERGDWNLVCACIEQLDDVPEETLVLALSKAQEPIKGSTGKHALDRLLRLVVQAPSTPSTLRGCLRKHLTAADLKPILLILDNWLLELQANSILPLSGATKSEKATVPPLQDILPFFQALLDAHLVTLLQSQQLHGLVQLLSQHILHAITLSSSLQDLQGPLRAFTAAQKVQHKKQLDAKSRKGNNSKRTLAEKWEQKKSLQANQLSLGDYAIETFAL